MGAADAVLDAVHQLIAGIDIDTGIPVTHSSVLVGHYAYPRSRDWADSSRPRNPAKWLGVVTPGLVVSYVVIRSLQEGMGTVKQVAGKQRSRMKALAALLLAGALVLCTAAPAWGVVVNNLYDAVVEVPNTGERARREGFEQALAQVLVRLTGSREVLETLGSESGERVGMHF